MLYIILQLDFSFLRDRSQISHLARQLYPGQSQFMVEAFAECTAKPHSYMLIDNTQEAEDDLRLRSSILLENGVIVVWMKED